MGVDAGFFAKKAKRYFWFDRLSNIQRYWDIPYGQPMIRDQANDIYYKLEDKRSATGAETIRLLEINILAWMEADESQHYRIYWLSRAKEFIEAFPDDEFFIATDSADACDLIGDMHGRKDSWTGPYSEWTPKGV